MKKQIKRKITIGFFISIFLLSSLFFLSNNTLGATQDDKDTQATLHATLKTNSEEIQSSLMTTGTFSFFDEPELDVGTFSHDSTRIDVSDIQAPIFNTTTITNYQINDGIVGNHTTNSSEIEGYLLSAPLDTTIQLNITFSTNNSIRFYYTGTSYDISGQETAPYGIFLYNTYFYLVGDNNDKIFKYNSDWSYTGISYDVSGQDNTPVDIYYNGTNWLLLGNNHDKVYKYNSDWSYTGTSYDISGQDHTPTSFDYDGTYWWMCGYEHKKVYKYNSDWSYTGISYDVSGQDSIPISIDYDGTNWWLLGNNNDKIFKYNSDWSYTGTYYDVGTEDKSPISIYDDGSYWWMCGYEHKKVYKYSGTNPFSNVYINNFTYQKLGIDYNESFTCIFDSDNSVFNSDYSNGTLLYYFDSTMFSHYAYLTDIIISQQNLSISFDVLYTNVEINVSFYIAYSSNSWRVPTEIVLTINGEECADSTFNSGFISLNTYPTSLVITATESVYFKLNITVDFSFTFNLVIISKTYLKKLFELESDHEINIEQMVFNTNLNIKKIYLNNVDKGSSNPCSLSPPVSMNTGNIYTLEIILMEEIYLPLSYLYNHLGSGTSNIYLSGISNTLTFSNINGNHLYSIVLPSDWHVEYAQLTFSDLDYLPSYTPNYTDDLNGYGYSSQSYPNEVVDWESQYYQTNANGSFLEDSGGSGYEKVYSEYFSTLNSYMSHNYGDLDGYNSTYTVNDYLYMQNLFPQELNYEDWVSWVHTYNSEYISSSFDNTGVNLTSVLNSGSYLDVPPFVNFDFTNGTHSSDGSLYTIDGDYSTENAGGSLNYTSINFNVTDQDTKPQGIVRAGDYFYMLGGDTPKVYQYHENFTYTGTSYDISTHSLTPRGICWDGSMWIVDTNGDNVDKYNINFVYQGTSPYVGGQSTDPKGLVRIGSYYYLGGGSKIYKYTTAWSYTGTSYDVSGQDGNPRGLYYDGTHIYMCGTNNAKVYRFTSSWVYTGDSFDVSSEDIYPIQFFANFTNLCLLGYQTHVIYLYDIISELNFTAQFTTQKFYLNNTVESLTLFYSYKTDESIEISFSVWNYDLARWDLINQSINIDNFFDFNIVLNSSYYSSSNPITLKSEGEGTVEFELYIDKLVVGVNWTKTSGEIYSTISKDIDFSFLDRYDSYGDYQKLYNITIEFLYRYSNYTFYSKFAEFTYDGNNYTLIKDGSWHTVSLNFEFDSSNTDHFSVLFNITNGLLELNSNLNYSIFFECLLNTSYYDNYPDNLNYENIGETNPSWVDIKNLLGAEVIIVDEWQDHKNVLRLSNLLGQSPYVVHGLDTPATSGTVELYIGSSDVSKNQQWVFAGAVNYHIFLRIKNSKLYYLDSGFTEHEIQSVVSAKWYHIKVIWRADDTYDVYVDNIKTVDNVAMVQNQVAGVAGLIVQTSGDSGTYYSYTDAPSEVSHPNYNEGDNLRMREVTEIYQYFRYLPSLSLDYLQRINGNWILNFTYNFNPSTDAGIYNFYNSVNYSLLSILVYINDESGWESPLCYNYNTTQSNIDFSLNITNFLQTLGMSQFNDFYLEIYLSGNRSNFTLDNLTLFDFDSSFYEVSAVWISDTLVISHQNVSLFWIASDRYIDHIEITQEFDDIEYLLYNSTLLNNTLQFFEFWNITAGFYELNLTFYDNYSNWEKWTCNFTIWNRISISTAYKNPIFINEVNRISVHLDCEYSINKIWYDNSTDYILYYDNSSYPLYSFEFNFTYSSSVETTYNISVKVLGEYNDTFYCNISLLSVIERATMLDFNNLYSSYYQDEILNITFNLRDLYNNPISNKLLNFTIQDPLGSFIVNSSGTTNAYGNVSYNLAFNTSCELGFYHLNVSFAKDKNYTGVWKLQSFQVRPILRPVNSTDINLKINNQPVMDNYIQINWTNNFSITNYNTSTFDMNIALKLNLTESISYSQYLTYTNTFSATSDILSLALDNATLFNYPSNFTDYYFDSAESSNYAISGNRFKITDLLGDIFYNHDDFSIYFTYLDTSQVERIQLTKTPRTDSNTVQFKEYLTANRSFSYWYFHNNLNISSVSLYHNRTGTTIDYTDFTIENSNYYFEKSCLSGDLFTATTTYVIDWNKDWVNSQILSDNGTYCQIKITYQAPIDIHNVTIVLNLKSEGLYAEKWDHNATQSDLTYILELPGINFTTSQQTITLTGISSVPVISFSYVINEDGFKISDEELKIKVTDEKWRTIKKATWEDLDEFLIGYLEIPKYSEAFRIVIESDWELDGIHYGNQYYDIEANGYFECDGFGTGITTAYLRFKTNPLSDLKRTQTSGEVVYRINAKYRLDNVDFIFYIEEKDYYNKQNMIKELEDEVDCDKIIEYYTVEDRIYYMIINLNLDEGKNIIVINYKIERMANYAWLFLIMAIVLIGFGVIYITIRYTDNRIKDFISLDKIVKHFFWIKKSKREQLLKKNRYKPKKKIRKG